MLLEYKPPSEIPISLLITSSCVRVFPEIVILFRYVFLFKEISKLILTESKKSDVIGLTSTKA